MGVRTPKMRNGMYYGALSEKQAQLILDARQKQKFDTLKNMVFDFPVDVIMRASEEGISVRELMKRDNIDYSVYYGELRDYQTIGMAFMYLSPRSMIADGVGLGKTVEISALLNLLRYRKEMTRFLIAVEASAIAQTQAELIRFTGMNVITLPSEAPKMKRTIEKMDWGKVDGIVIKHSSLKSDTFSKWLARNLNDKGGCRVMDTFILDESSVIKNQNTKTYKYTKNICDLCRRVHMMNATAFETSIMDIYYQMDMMNDVLLPTKTAIERKYCEFERGEFWRRDADGTPQRNFKRELAGYKNQELFKQSLKLVYFGRCKKDIGMDTPNVYKVYEVEPSTKQAVAINDGYRYMEVLNSPENIPELGIEMNRSSVPKLNRLCELVENEFSGQQVMVYCWHINAQEAIKREMEAIGRKPVILNGMDKSKDKDINRYTIMEKFNSGEYDVIITNIKRSLNLKGGDVCIFYAVESNPSKATQIAGRIDRNVDDKIKTFILLLYKNTPEADMFKTVVKQREMDSRSLTIDAEGAVSKFIEAMKEDGMLE